MANQLSDLQNEICITEKWVRGKTLQGGEVCIAFLQACGKNLLTAGCNEGHKQQFVDKYTPSLDIHRPHSYPSFTSCPEIHSAVGRHSGALLCGTQRGEQALHMVHLCGGTTEVPSTSWSLHIHAEGRGEDKVPPATQHNEEP